jgi:alkylhydroperoxidase/carboxymuconolactone decarboxylase family protein YurZ
MARIPKRFTEFMAAHPEIGRAYKALGDATEEAGPLEPKTIRLVKLGIAVGLRHESAVKSHTRRSLEAGCTPEEIRHTIILSTTTIGFPSMMAALSWADDVIAERSSQQS